MCLKWHWLAPMFKYRVLRLFGPSYAIECVVCSSGTKSILNALLNNSEIPPVETTTTSTTTSTTATTANADIYNNRWTSWLVLTTFQNERSITDDVTIDDDATDAAKSGVDFVANGKQTPQPPPPPPHSNRISLVRSNRSNTLVVKSIYAFIPLVTTYLITCNPF